MRTRNWSVESSWLLRPSTAKAAALRASAARIGQARWPEPAGMKQSETIATAEATTVKCRPTPVVQGCGELNCRWRKWAHSEYSMAAQLIQHNAVNTR